MIHYSVKLLLFHSQLLGYEVDTINSSSSPITQVGQV